MIFRQQRHHSTTSVQSNTKSFVSLSAGITPARPDLDLQPFSGARELTVNDYLCAVQGDAPAGQTLLTLEGLSNEHVGKPQAPPEGFPSYDIFNDPKTHVPYAQDYPISAIHDGHRLQLERPPTPPNTPVLLSIFELHRLLGRALIIMADAAYQSSFGKGAYYVDFDQIFRVITVSTNHEIINLLIRDPNHVYLKKPDLRFFQANSEKKLIKQRIQLMYRNLEQKLENLLAFEIDEYADMIERLRTNTDLDGCRAILNHLACLYTLTFYARNTYQTNEEHPLPPPVVPDLDDRRLEDIARSILSVGYVPSVKVFEEIEYACDIRVVISRGMQGDVENMIRPYDDNSAAARKKRAEQAKQAKQASVTDLSFANSDKIPLILNDQKSDFGWGHHPKSLSGIGDQFDGIQIGQEIGMGLLKGAKRILVPKSLLLKAFEWGYKKIKGRPFVPDHKICYRVADIVLGFAEKVAIIAAATALGLAPAVGPAGVCALFLLSL